MRGFSKSLGRDDAGFTLIETIVAFFCFAAVFVYAQYNFTRSLRALEMAQGQSAALELARSVLQSAGSAVQVTGDQSGESNGIRWALRADKYVLPDPLDVPDQVVGYWLRVDVAWKERGPVERRLSLQTLKLFPAQ